MKKLLLVLLPLTILPAHAARLCPEGKSYDHEQCREVVEQADGTVEVYPVGKSHDSDQTVVGRRQADGSMRFCPKHQSHRSDLCWTVR